MNVPLIGDYAILRRITGLKSVEFKSRPSKFQVGKESFNRRDKQADGQFLDEFRENVIPGVVTGLAPFWNDIKDTYWLESRAILDDLVNNIRAFYQKGHELEGQRIKAEDVDPGNYYDAFFQSEIVQSRRMEGGSYMFDLKVPLDILLYYCYKNDPRVLVRDGREISKYVVGNAKYELILPKHDVIEDRETIDRNIDALTKLGAMSFDKQKIIARLMKLRVNSYENPDPDELKVAIGQAASDTKKSSRYDGLSGQSRFLELANLSNEDLMLNLDIDKAIEYRIITSYRNVFELNGETLEGIDDKSKLFRYFRQDSNTEKYKDLIFLLGERDKQAG